MISKPLWKKTQMWYKLQNDDVSVDDNNDGDDDKLTKHSGKIGGG